MKHFLYAFISFLFLSGMVQAETGYVSGVMEVTLRTGQGTSNKVIAMVRSGEALEMLETGDRWTRVRIPSGKEGWILTRFITNERPRKLQLERLKKKYEKLADRYNTLKEKSAGLKVENAKLSEALAARNKGLSEVTTAFEALKERSAEFFELETNYKKSSAELSRQKERTELLEDRLSEKNIRWFLCGAGVLFTGILLGGIARRKKQTSYYGI